MRNIFTKIFAVMAMSVMTLTVFADTAIMHSKIGENGADIEAANSWTGLSGSTAEGFIVDMPDNTSKNFSQAGWVSYNETNYKAIKNSNGQRIRIQLPSGKEAQSVSLYVYTNSEVEAAMRFNGVDVEDVVPAESTNENPAIITKALENETSFDFTFYNSDPSKNAQVCFIAVITYRNQPTIDPTRLFTFGYEATVVDEGETHTISALTLHEDNCDDVTTGNLNEAYNVASDKKVYHGTSTQFVDALSYRSMKGETHISSQEVAETEGTYMGYNLTIAENHFLTITKISTDIFNIKNDLYYEFVIQNSSEVTLYKSAVQTISRPQSGNHRIELTNKSDAWRAALSGLQGEIQVKLIFWSSNSSEYIAPSEFYVTGLVHEKTSQTKTIKRIDVNGVEYDYENEGNTISTLLHAAPSVKFYYSVINNWSDGSQTAAPDEEETVIASASGNNYVATTTLASTPYNLTFTNIDLPKVFGITRAVAAETSNSTDMESDGVTPKTQNKYAVSADALVDPSVAHVTISQNYGGRNTLTNSSRSFVWFNGIEAQDCFVDYGELSDRTSSNDFNENQYFGFDLTVYLGYKVSLTELVSDALIEKDKTGLHYLVKIYNNDVEVASMPDVEVTSKGVDMKRVIDLSENAALQDLTGKVTVKMFVYGNSGKYIIVKDLNVSAAVEANPGEGENSFTFVRYDEGTTKYVFNHDGGLDQEKKPTFTDGEVTVYFERADGNKVKTHENNSGSVKMEGGHSITVSVPEDSYISEVEFINNGEGNNVDGIAFNLTITNDVAATVGSLNQQKAGSHIWSCGELRESELTFLQGATGNFYLKSIRVVYLKKDADPDKSFTRTHAHMNLNTLCFPYTVTAYTGGTFYEMLYKRMESSVPVEVVLVEHEGNLVAGTPYFYMPEGSQLDLTYSGHRENTPSKVNGVKGIYDEQTVPSGSYVTYNGEIRLVGSNVTLSEYRAYINMDEVDEESAAPAPAPGKKLLRIRNANAPAVTTDVESIQHSEFSIQKVLHNGQLFIIRDGKVYNAQGKIVK